MGKAVDPAAYLWEILARQKIKVLPDVWEAWQEAMGPSLGEIRALVGQATFEPISIKDACAINAAVNHLTRVFKEMGRCDGGVSRVSDGKILFHAVIKDLMGHYVGNSLYKIALMSDLFGDDPEPLAPEVRRGIARCLDDIEAVVSRLQAATQPEGTPS